MQPVADHERLTPVKRKATLHIEVMIFQWGQLNSGHDQPIAEQLHSWPIAGDLDQHPPVCVGGRIPTDGFGDSRHVFGLSVVLVGPEGKTGSLQRCNASGRLVAGGIEEFEGKEWKEVRLGLQSWRNRGGGDNEARAEDRLWTTDARTGAEGLPFRVGSAVTSLSGGEVGNGCPERRVTYWERILGPPGYVPRGHLGAIGPALVWIRRMGVCP